ncbi:hypothetical protein B0T24DRAFT_163831 [Lasiosphaeria ovina]|uniref:Transmembrane protein n=1 Tax=Lasiosphaeria ovina TaxID=92902 RepID=A0AAE0NDQ7_9PEZI|nr:hypothetical protein B0T24DRAFT_163831 [Lasiosphaeria ovina]
MSIIFGSLNRYWHRTFSCQLQATGNIEADSCVFLDAYVSDCVCGWLAQLFMVMAFWPWSIMTNSRRCLFFSSSSSSFSFVLWLTMDRLVRALEATKISSGVMDETRPRRAHFTCFSFSFFFFLLSSVLSLFFFSPLYTSLMGYVLGFMSFRHLV